MTAGGALFIPLKAEHFDAFERGDKDTEYRYPGGAFAISRCWPGRRVLLSRGYGKHRRRAGRIVAREIVPISAAPPAARAIYPRTKHLIAIKIELDA